MSEQIKEQVKDKTDEQSTGFFAKGTFGNADGYIKPGEVEIRRIQKGRLNGNMDLICRDFHSYFQFQLMDARISTADANALKDQEYLKGLAFRNESPVFSPVIKINALQYNEGIDYYREDGVIKAVLTNPFSMDVGKAYSGYAHAELDFHYMAFGESYKPEEIGATEYALVFPWLSQREDNTDCSPAIPVRGLGRWFEFLANAEGRNYLPGWAENLEDIVLASNTTLFDMATREIIGSTLQFMGRRK